MLGDQRRGDRIDREIARQPRGVELGQGLFRPSLAVAEQACRYDHQRRRRPA